MIHRHATDFEVFVDSTRPRLRRAFAGWIGPDEAEDAVAEAFAYAWEHWEEVQVMVNPVGYLYRVGQSRSRRRLVPRLPAPEALGVPDIEPGLVPALSALPATQRASVWLVHACGWTYAEAAEALQTSVSMVGNHVQRGMARLRAVLAVATDA